MEKVECKTEGWAPLGQASSSLLNEEVIVNIAKKYNKTPAQVILRWHIQSGFITIPKSCKAERIKENFEIFDFNLTDDEFKSINELDGKKGRLQYNKYLLKFAFWIMPSLKD